MAITLVTESTRPRYKVSHGRLDTANQIVYATQDLPLFEFIHLGIAHSKTCPSIRHGKPIRRDPIGAHVLSIGARIRAPLTPASEHQLDLSPFSTARRLLSVYAVQ